KAWEKLFGFRRREMDGPLDASYCHMALAIQQLTEEIVIRLAREARQLTGLDHLCLAGGVALNCVANGKLHQAGIFRELYIQPAAGDAGGALGAAYAAHHIYFGQERTPGADDATGRADTGGGDGMKGAYLGPEFGEPEVLRVARKYGAVFQQIDDLQSLTASTAALIDQGKVVGWFQGRMEFGPRALGARSILADARNPDMQRKLNLSIKFREGFRPFAPAMLAGDVAQHFETGGENPFISPYMLLVKELKPSQRRTLPSDYAGWPLMDKIRFPRSDLPAITHVDYSARIQTVHRATNPRFWQLLHAFRDLTGCGVLINTSFNVKDEPIVHTPEEAYRCFMQTEMDWLVIGNLMFDKSRQPPWKQERG
ncbi:MAG: carbamoyltransferase C-terminal domain-containing protein, partial [Bacteroidota bacterium]|nr:carbamoyltransferase C-terminal domain-containing protein [Bacteroidota bacterium]